MTTVHADLFYWVKNPANKGITIIHQEYLTNVSPH